MGKHVYLKNVSTLKLFSEKCVGCGICVNVCPHQILTVEGGKCQISDINSCMECGACAMNCSFSAIEVKKGVGCFSAIVRGVLTGTEPSCGCSNGTGGC